MNIVLKDRHTCDNARNRLRGLTSMLHVGVQCGGGGGGAWDAIYSAKSATLQCCLPILLYGDSDSVLWHWQKVWFVALLFQRIPKQWHKRVWKNPQDEPTKHYGGPFHQGAYWRQVPLCDCLRCFSTRSWCIFFFFFFVIMAPYWEGLDTLLQICWGTSGLKCWSSW